MARELLGFCLIIVSALLTVAAIPLQNMGLMIAAIGTGFVGGGVLYRRIEFRVDVPAVIIIALVAFLLSSGSAAAQPVTPGDRVVCLQDSGPCHVYRSSQDDDVVAYESNNEWVFVQSCESGYRSYLKRGETCMGYWVRRTDHDGLKESFEEPEPATTPDPSAAEQRLKLYAEQRAESNRRFRGKFSGVQVVLRIAGHGDREKAKRLYAGQNSVNPVVNVNFVRSAYYVGTVDTDWGPAVVFEKEGTAFFCGLSECIGSGVPTFCAVQICHTIGR